MPALVGMDGTTRMRGQQYNNRVYCFNGRNRMRCYDGNAWSFAGIVKDPTAAIPSVAVNGAVGASPNALNGQYAYLIQFTNQNHFNTQGYVVAAIPNPISAYITLNGQGCTVGNIPATHPDPQVTHVDIYRTLGGAFDSSTPVRGQNYYYVASVPIGTTTYLDIIADATIQEANNIRFSQNFPPMFGVGVLFGERLFGSRFIPITAGTCASAASTITFTGVTIPDGVIGCWFQATGDKTLYLITASTPTTVTLASAYSGALVGSGYAIFRYPWEVYYSEFQDPEAWGDDGEAFRNVLNIPGKEPCTALITYQGKVWVFSFSNIYWIYGKGADNDSIDITTEPQFGGLGCVGPDALCRVEDDLYFMSVRGPALINGGAPQLIGNQLLTDWIDSLNATDLALCVVGGNRRSVWFAAPAVTGDTECSKLFRFDRITGEWWEEKFAVPYFYYMDDGDNSDNAQLFCAQNTVIWQPNKGSTDIASQTFIDSVKVGGNNVLTATVNTGGLLVPNGLQECYVHFFRANASGGQTYLGSRRISGNTVNTVTWANSGVGGGTLSLLPGDAVEIGIIWWRWKTRTLEAPGAIAREFQGILSFDHLDASQSVILTEFYDVADPGGKAGGELTQKSGSQTITADQIHKRANLNTRAHNYAILMESRRNAQVRSLTLPVSVKSAGK